MKVLITGATGFIGSHLAPYLAQEHEVFCLARNVSKLPRLSGITPISADLSYAGFVKALPAQMEAIVHLAQANAPFPEQATELFEVNAASTQRLADYALSSGVGHFLYASSGSVYAPSTQPLSEESSVAPQGLYPLTKEISEKVLTCYKGYYNVACLRLFAPYGPGQTARMIPGIINRVRSGQTVTLTNRGQPRINPIYIDDVLRIFHASLMLEGCHTVNVAGPDVVSIADIATIAGDTLGVAATFEHRSDADGVDLIASTKRMAELFTIGMLVGAREGIQRTVKAMVGA